MLDLVEEAFRSLTPTATSTSTSSSSRKGPSSTSNTTHTNSCTTNNSSADIRYTPFGRYERLDGRMTQASRAKAVADFNEDDEVSILLISLK